MDDLVKNRLEKHLGSSSEFSLKNEDGTEDTFIMKQLEWEHMPKYMAMVNSLKNHLKYVGTNGIELTKEELRDESIKRIDVVDYTKMSEDELKTIQKVIEISMKSSYPEWDEIKLKQFCMTNFEQLINIVFETNSPQAGKVQEELKKDGN